MRGIALGGFMGTGKTTAGGQLASALGLPFLDLDDLLVQQYGPIREQFAVVGERGFRVRERQMLLEVVASPRVVLATGGGTWVDPRNRADLGRAMDRVVLTASLEVLRARVGRDSARPLWDDAVEARFAARRAAYEDADLVVDTGDGGVDEVVARILAWREARGARS